jgi:hypothetical protein
MVKPPSFAPLSTKGRTLGSSICPCIVQIIPAVFSETHVIADSKQNEEIKRRHETLQLKETPLKRIEELKFLCANCGRSKD